MRPVLPDFLPSPQIQFGDEKYTCPFFRNGDRSPLLVPHRRLVAQLTSHRKGISVADEKGKPVRHLRVVVFNYPHLIINFFSYNYAGKFGLFEGSGLGDIERRRTDTPGQSMTSRLLPSPCYDITPLVR